MSQYSETVMEHFLEPCNRGALESPSGVGVSGVPGAGPFLVFQIGCTGSTVTSVAFQSHSCGVTVASGSMLTTLVLGKSLDECLLISDNDLETMLGGVPPDKMHVPQFAVLAMRQAVHEAAN